MDPQNPYEAPESQSDAPDVDSRDQIVATANTALFLAIIGFFCCGIILGPVALVKVNGVRREREKLVQPHVAEGVLNAAQVIAVIAIVWNLIGFARFVVP